MEANWIEIKRFLNDYKKNIILGSVVIAILFAVSIYLIGIFKEEAQQEGQEDFEINSETLLNEAQPAYFQIYIEYEDGTAYGNPSIIKQYFNLNSIKEQIKKETGIDIKSIEEEVFFNDLNDEIEVITVTRNESSYLLTATFNLGNEQDNLIVAEYYYDLLYSEDFPILTDKKSIVFSEPTLTVTRKLKNELDSTESQKNLFDDLIKNIINITIGFIFGIVLMIGIKLLKVIYGETLDYSFGYEVEENNDFLLYDKQLQNEEIVSQFIKIPYDKRKIIVTEKRVDSKDQKLIYGNQQVVFNKDTKQKETFLEISSINKIDESFDDVQVVIIIKPQITTRKWYKNQMQLAAVKQLSTKVIQINQ